jgi:hypothetical protein
VQNKILLIFTNNKIKIKIECLSLCTVLIVLVQSCKVCQNHRIQVDKLKDQQQQRQKEKNIINYAQ